MNTITFSTASASHNATNNKSLAPFIRSQKKLDGWSGNTPNGYNAGPSEIEIECKVLAREKHIRFPDGEIRWADIYTTPDGDVLAVRQKSGGPRQIAMLEFYKQADFGFSVLSQFGDYMEKVQQKYYESGCELNIAAEYAKYEE